MGTIKKIINHYRRWNKWRKFNMNGPLYKFLVLIGFAKSPTLPTVLLPEECDEILRGFLDGLTEVQEFEDRKSVV